RLLERLENELLLIFGDSDTGVRHRDLDRAVRIAQNRMVLAPSAFGAANGQRHAAFRRELKGVRQQVEDDLLKPLLVSPDCLRKLAVELDVEVEPLVRRQLPERALHVLL